MAKTLSESAAEILNASIGKNQEPAAKLAQFQDLGGATPQDDYSAPGQSGDDESEDADGADNSVGKAAAAGVQVAPRPVAGGKAAPQEQFGQVKSQGLAKPATGSQAAGFAEEIQYDLEVAENVIAEDYSADTHAYVVDQSSNQLVLINREDLDGYIAEGWEEVSEAFTDKIMNAVGKTARGLGRIAGKTARAAVSVPAAVAGGVAGLKDAAKQAYAAGKATTGSPAVHTAEEAKKEWIKEKISARKGSMVEDVNALFNGESLSEEFRGKATVIFEAAVMSRVETILEDVLADNDQVLEEAVAQIQEEMSSQVDEYLDYVVEQWMQENQVAVDSGLRAELSEEFIAGLKSLFEQHYIEIPEEKVDVAEELAEQLVSMQEAFAAREQEFAALSEELNASKKEKLIGLTCEGLTQVQASKMKSLAEGVEFTTEGDYKNKLAVIRESYFPSKVQVNSEVKKVIQETTLDQSNEEVVKASGLMSHYVNAITKTVPKF